MGAQNIIIDGKIKASLGYMRPGDVANGNGVYLTKLEPRNHTRAEIALNNWMNAAPENIRRTENHFVLDITDRNVEDTSTDGRSIFLYGCKKDLHLHKYPWWLMNFNSDRVIASYRYRISSLGPANSTHPHLMGDYTIIDETINGRPVYRSNRGSYLFMNSDGGWIVRHGDFRDEGALLYQDSNYSLGPISDEPWKYWVDPSSDASSDDSDDSDDFGWLSDDATLKCHGWQM